MRPDWFDIHVLRKAAADDGIDLSDESERGLIVFVGTIAKEIDAGLSCQSDGTIVLEVKRGSDSVAIRFVARDRLYWAAALAMGDVTHRPYGYSSPETFASEALVSHLFAPDDLP